MAAFLRNVTVAAAALRSPGEVMGNMSIAGDPDFAIRKVFPIVYVVFGPGGVPEARAVVRSGEPCPTLSVDYKYADQFDDLKVHLRAEGTSAMPFAFPVRVCEATLPRDLPANSTWLGGRLLPPVTSSPDSFVLIGDTGMRVKPKNLGDCAEFGDERLYDIKQCVKSTPFDPNLVSGEYQALADWPLERSMDAAAAERPDVVVHAGDYFYRQGPCAKGTGCEAINNAGDRDMPGEWGDNWNGWYADFFEPSASLLRAAPWVVARGNHESCHRGGHGFFMFLDPRPLPANWTTDYCQERTDAYAVPFQSEQFLVVDDNFVGDVDIDDHGQCPETTGEEQGQAMNLSRFEDPDESEEHAEIQQEIDYFAEQFRGMRALSQSHRTNFYLGHHPLLAVACYKESYAAVDWTLQRALEDSPGMLDRVAAVITGHVHFFQGLQFQDGALPLSLVVGNGGTKLDDISIESPSAVDGLEVFGGAKVASSHSLAGVFGFCTMRRSSTEAAFELRAFQSGNDGTEPFVFWETSIPLERGNLIEP